MEFRYDFGEKLDLTRFRKQAIHYMSSMREITYILYLPNYKVIAEITTPDNLPGHLVSIYFSEIIRDSSGTIVSDNAIIPLTDSRFKEIKDIQNLFKIDHYKAYMTSYNSAETVNQICNLLRLVHKINRLKVFL